MESAPSADQATDYSILEKLESIITSTAPKNSNAATYPINTAATLIRKLYKYESRPEDELAGLFDETIPFGAKTFTAAFFCRLHARRQGLLESRTRFLPRFVQLVDQVAPAEIYLAKKIADRSQTFEKSEAIAATVNTCEQALEKIIAGFTDLSLLGSFRQSFLQNYRSKVTQFLIVPFLPNAVSNDGKIRELLLSIQEYTEELSMQKMRCYTRTIEVLDEFDREISECPTEYSNRFLGQLTSKARALVQSDFEKSPFTKSASLEIQPTGKKYPFGQAGARFSITLKAINRGPGHIFDLQLEITDYSNLEVPAPKVFLGELPAAEQLVNFPASVKITGTDTIIICRATWRLFDGTFKAEDCLINLDAQKCDIDWETLKDEEPYALEPVSNEAQFIGRRMILSRLLGLATAPSVGSSMIVGQKRVGKTSVAKTLKNTLNHTSNEITTIYIESGDYITPSPEGTVAALGNAICLYLIQEIREITHLAIPTFTDSIQPIIGFLSEVTRILPTRKFIFILDEFDELPLPLYQRSQIGDAMFLALRSISGKPPFGFVLVGSEKLRLILSTQGEKLNKFTQFNIDYFTKESEWDNYCELVRKPVAHCLEIDDQAVVHIHEQTAGNPFFTKLICRELFTRAVTNRDRHVTEREMKEAADIALSTASIVNFQHFWDDGILDSSDRRETISLARRKLLMAFADSLRPDYAVGKAELAKSSSEYGLDSVAFDAYLSEFQSRHILVSSEGFISCKVPFFARWLKDYGIKTIITVIADPEQAILMRRQSDEIRVKPSEVRDLVAKWGIYKGQAMTEDRVRAWLEQFGADFRKQRLMFRLLTGLRFYNSALIRAKMREAHSRLTAGINWSTEGKKRADILVSYIDAPGKSGSFYAKLYADENEIYYKEIVEQHEIENRLISGKYSILLFVDDMFGTGLTAQTGVKTLLEPMAEVIRSKNIRVCFSSICAFRDAKIRIESSLNQITENSKVYISELLTDSDRAFHESSKYYEDKADIEAAKTIAYTEGRKLEPKCPLGYGDSEAVIVFESSCPNNSLPILWSGSKTWIPLFRR